MTQDHALRDLIRADNFIDGKWVPAATGERFAVTDPATGDVIVQVADSGPADARAATDAAARAFPAWRNTLPKDRAAVLHRWHALIVENADALGRLISLEQGKPFAEGRGEVMYGASYVAWFADEATRIYGDIIPQQQRGKREPIAYGNARCRHGYTVACSVAVGVAAALGSSVNKDNPPGAPPSSRVRSSARTI